MDLALISLLAYLVGSIPTAYIFSMLFQGRDIRETGTGNVGTLNYYRLSGSRAFSAAVLLIDAGKGVVAVWAALRFLPPGQWIFPVAAALIGHIYPVWLRGKGGRGLATLAGVFLVLKPLLVAVWWVPFAAVYFSTKKYIIAGVAALLIVNMVAVIFLNSEIFVVLSASSLIVIHKYLPRLRDELQSKTERS